MERRSLVLSLFAIGCFIATTTLIPGLGTAQADKVKAAMADLKAKTEKLGAPKVERKDLYFGTTKVDNSVVEAVGGVATLFVKSGDQYARVATTVKKEDCTSAVGTAWTQRAPLLQGSTMAKRTMDTRPFSARLTTLDMSPLRTHLVRSSGLTSSASQHPS